MSLIPLGPQQQRAFDKLCAFFEEDDKRSFLLKGHAGTGKTTLLRHAIAHLTGKERDFVLIAPTGRAAKVLSDITHRPASTIHSLIYQLADFNLDLGQLAEAGRESYEMDDSGQLLLQFTQTIRKEVSDRPIIYFVDESSLIGDHAPTGLSNTRYGTGRLLRDLFTYDSLGKFVFIGDPCQLPPIGNSVSPALLSPYLRKTFGLSPEGGVLTEVYRQEETSGILQAAIRLRELIETEHPPSHQPSLEVANKSGIHVLPDHDQLIDHYYETLKAKGPEFCIMIASTNKLRDNINSRIRQRLYGDLSKQLQPNDVLLVNQNNLLVDLVNGDFVRVVTVAGTVTHQAGFQFQKVKVSPLHAPGRNYELLLLVQMLTSVRPQLDNHDFKTLWIDFTIRMKEIGIYPKTRAFEDAAKSDPYINALNASYGYATTCNKAQGGEWESIYLYQNYQLFNMMPKAINLYKWWYTALTRARSEIFLTHDWFIT